MNVLSIEVAPTLTPADLDILSQRGYFVRSVRTTAEALELVSRSRFDCVVVGIPDSADAAPPELTEIRQFARDSAVALITAASAESIVARSFAQGAVERQTARTLGSTLRKLPAPTLVVASHFDPIVMRSIRRAGVAAASASTLMLAMNLLVDGWCHIVLLEADIPGLTDEDGLVVFHRIEAPMLAVLASALATGPSGIVHRTGPKTGKEFIKLLEQAADNRLSECGLTRTGT